MDEGEAASHPLRAQAEADLSRVIVEIVAVTGLQTRWRGIVVVRGLDFLHAGQKHGWCGISLREDILSVSEYRWPTMIHEGLHSVSAAFSAARLDPVSRRWEEAIVEQTQRILRPGLLESLGVTLDDGAVSARDASHRYNGYIGGLEAQRQSEQTASLDFYLRLLRSAPRERIRMLIAAVREVASRREEEA